MIILISNGLPLEEATDILARLPTPCRYCYQHNKIVVILFMFFARIVKRKAIKDFDLDNKVLEEKRLSVEISNLARKDLQ